MSGPIAVVGAGVLGVSVAWRLAEAGERVVLIDRVGPAAGTSRHGAGVVSHLAWHPLNVALIRESARVFRDLTREGEGAPGFRFAVTGSATLAAAHQADRLRELAVMQRAAGAVVDLVPPDKLAAVPGLAEVRVDDVALAAVCPEDGWGSPPDYVDAVVARFEAAGGRFRRATVDGLRVREGRLEGLVVDGVFEPVSRAVVAGGVWTAALLGASGLPVPARAYRTQAALCRTDLAAPPAVLHDAVQGFYLRPDAHPVLLAGNGTTTRPEDPAALKTEADNAFLMLTRKRLRWRFPRLAELEVARAWAFIDTATPDRHPLAGPDPRAEGLHLLLGGNGFGFMRSPALGAAVAAGILGARAALDLSLFSPARFAGREKEDFRIAEGFTL